MRQFLRVMTAVMAVLFTFGLVVQYNDPDPLRWMVIYGAAALACGLAVLRRMPRWLPVVVAVAALAWSAALLPGVAGRVAPGEMFEEFEMKSPEVEQAREAVGLGIIAAWMIVLAVAAPRLSRAGP
jgi:hypothetical protein